MKPVSKTKTQVWGLRYASLKMSATYRNLLVLGLMTIVTTRKVSALQKPHLIFVMIDDWGFYEAGFKGNALAQTPFIDGAPWPTQGPDKA